MGNGISSSDRIRDFLRDLSRKYSTGGIWISKRLGRRWSFWCGLEPELLLPPQMLIIDEDYALFCENKELIEKDWEEIRKELRTLLKESFEECR